MHVRDLSVYHYSVDVQSGDVPERFTPHFGPSFRVARMLLQVAFGDHQPMWSVSGPVDTHPSFGDERRREGWGLWDAEVPDRVRHEAARQVSVDAMHLSGQADFLFAMSERLLMVDARQRFTM